MDTHPIREGTILWKPDKDAVNRANMTKYMQWLASEKELAFEDYQSLWQWSVAEIEEFWVSLWEFFDIRSSRPFDRVLAQRKMPGAEWFKGAELNYAEHVFRNQTAERPALIFQSEIQPLMEVSWDELSQNVASVAAALRGMGIKPGDRVSAYIPNIPQTVMAFLACASIGATWSSCSPDFGTRSVVDRFRQIEPKVLFAVDGYRYGGKGFDCSPAVAEIRRALPTLEQTIIVPYLQQAVEIEKFENSLVFDDLLTGHDELAFEQVPFDHPLWVVYSSGTTGLPKGLVHGHGGILLEFMKFAGLHMDVHPGVWRHGDWVRFTERGSGVILGRSDSTINRLGVRMGSSEIYAAVEDLPEVDDSLVIGVETGDGNYFMPLFVVTAGGIPLSDELRQKINHKIRTTLSPRHVPDDIFAIADVPRTLNLKKLEVPVKKILAGIPVEKAVNLDSMSNPDSIEYFVKFAEKMP